MEVEGRESSPLGPRSRPPPPAFDGSVYSLIVTALPQALLFGTTDPTPPPLKSNPPTPSPAPQLRWPPAVPISCPPTKAYIQVFVRTSCDDGDSEGAVQEGVEGSG